MTILRVSGYSGKNIESAKLEGFPNVTKRQTQSEMTIFRRRKTFVLGSNVCANHSALEIIEILVIMAERILYRSVHARFKAKGPTPSFAYSWVTLR
jgi:hypothetical protein